MRRGEWLLNDRPESSGHHILSQHTMVRSFNLQWHFSLHHLFLVFEEGTRIIPEYSDRVIITKTPSSRVLNWEYMYESSTAKWINPHTPLHVCPAQWINPQTPLDRQTIHNYNTTYILEDEGYYCSEYVYELFKKDSVFTLEPMTFKDPKTNEFHKGWIEHYQKLCIAIPEGKLGCNPNVRASSKTIGFVKNLQ